MLLFSELPVDLFLVITKPQHTYAYYIGESNL